MAERDAPVVDLRAIATEVVSCVASKVLDAALLAKMPRVECEALLKRESEMLLLKLTSQVVGTKGRKIEWDCSFPATWWDHWKHDFFLKKWTWWRRVVARFLSRPKLTIRTYTGYRYENICPHLISDNKREHVEFLADGRKPTPGHISMGTVIRELRFIQQDIAQSAGRIPAGDLVARSYDSTIEYLKGKYAC